jgi:hypothetical protein
MDGNFGIEEDQVGAPDPPAEERRSPDLSGEYRDPISYGILSAGIVLGGIFLAIDIPVGIQVKNFAVLIFGLLFPVACFLFAARGLIVSTLRFDRSGWHYRREILGRTLETEEGRWSEIGKTEFSQWGMSGRNGMMVNGELLLWDSRPRVVLRARTAFYSSGVPGPNHSPGKRQIGLSEDGFRSFVGMINDETPQLPYQWAQAEVPEDRPPFISFIYVNPGPARYVQVPRGSRAPASVESVDSVAAEPAESTESGDPVHLPTPF